MSAAKNRVALLDEFRGFCVLCMIFYHSFIFMYNQYGISFGYRAYSFFTPVQPFFSCAFMWVCGICCRLSHSNLKRGLKLLVLALLLNFVSIVVLPKLGFVETEIWFGILDFLSLCILLFALLEKPVSRINPIVGSIVCVLLMWIFRNWLSEGTLSLFGSIAYTLPEKVHEIEWLFPFGITSRGFFSADYFPLIPYMFVFFWGTFLGEYVRDGKIPRFMYPVRVPFLDWLGTHALLVYILHLPVIYVLLELYQWIVSNV